VSGSRGEDGISEPWQVYILLLKESKDSVPFFWSNSCSCFLL